MLPLTSSAATIHAETTSEKSPTDWLSTSL
jgi:hypothetical protein